MRDKRKITLVFLLAILMAALAGCGSSDSSSSSSSSGEATGNASFLKKGSKNTIVKFGQEADDAEREAASSVLEENLQARANGDWAAQCASLTATAIKQVEEGGAALGTKGDCSKKLEAQAQPVSETKAIRANTMTGPVAALRVEGIKAYALYHGTEGIDYAMPMTREGDEWKVDSLVTQELP
jgi:hypothetical protein